MKYTSWRLQQQAGVIDEAISFKNKVWQWMTDIGMWETVLFSALRILLILILSRFAIKLLFRVIDRSLERQEMGRMQVNPRRFITVGELLKNVTSFAGNFVMVMLILGELGIKLAPLIAGAGVLGLAIGFGAQNLVKDVITGFFIILEDQFAVGDVVQIGTLKGTVEMLGLRSTRLVSWTGEVHIIPNGTITNITNYSIGTALAVVDLPFSNSRRLEDTLELLKKAMLELKDSSDLPSRVPAVLGVQSLTASEYVVRIAADCLPGVRADLEREIQMAAKKALEEAEAEALRLAVGPEKTAE